MNLDISDGNKIECWTETKSKVIISLQTITCSTVGFLKEAWTRMKLKNCYSSGHREETFQCSLTYRFWSDFIFCIANFVKRSSSSLSICYSVKLYQRINQCCWLIKISIWKQKYSSLESGGHPMTNQSHFYPVRILPASPLVLATQHLIDQGPCH